MKRISIIIAIIVLFAGAICYKSYKMENPPLASDSYDKIEHLSASLLYYETTLEGLEKRSKSIARGRISGVPETVYSDYNRPKKMPLYTIIALEVTETYKGNIEVGKTIKIIEPYYIANRTLYTYGNYLPSRMDEEYIFFFGSQLVDKNPDLEKYRGAYFVDHDERGRYLVPKKGSIDDKRDFREELSLGELDTSVYMGLYKEVTDAYIRNSEAREIPIGKGEAIDIAAVE